MTEQNSQDEHAAERLPLVDFPGRVDFVTSAPSIKEAPDSTLPEVALCGRSNVGKSSLLNTLCNRNRLARVSTTPGRTRLLNFFNVQQKLLLVDLPGYGYATGDRKEIARWGESLQDYLYHRPQLALSLLLFDARRLPEKEEEELLLWFQHTGQPVIAVMTKADKVKKSRLLKQQQDAAKILGLKTHLVVPFSSLHKTGREELWQAIFRVTHPGLRTTLSQEGKA